MPMFSEKAAKTVTACRFCLMCRHLCPVGLTTGSESHTPRGKALLLNYVKTGMPFSAEMAEDMYACCLCHACAADCETGHEPPAYIREARTLAVVEDLAPAGVRKVIENLDGTGNIFGLARTDMDPALQKAIQALPAKADVLLYLGGTARFKTPEIALAVISLLKKAGVSFTVLADEPPSGAEHGDLTGFVDEVRRTARECAAAVAATGAGTLVCLDAAAARMMRQQYGEWGVSSGAEPVTATAYVAGLIRDGKLAPKAASLSATFQDDSALTRELDETEAPREIMAALGVSVKEMFLNRKRVKSGGTALLNEYAPRLAELAAKGRWADALRSKTPVLLTATPDTLHVMRKTAPDGMAVRDLFVLLDNQA